GPPTSPDFPPATPVGGPRRTTARRPRPIAGKPLIYLGNRMRTRSCPARSQEKLEWRFKKILVAGYTVDAVQTRRFNREFLSNHETA
ncbi:hypothetical protein, partial [Methylorubrum podarium]|uniref:hypothetical protein n=1 Tax=Methylorubrum podarium TaxID=200476 RepID=UPI001EE33D02